MNVVHLNCCGIIELQEISEESGPEAIIQKLMASSVMNTKKRPFAIFTGVVETEFGDERTYGQNLAAYIAANGLGDVVTDLPEKANWTYNIIKMWLWTLDHEALHSWYEKHKPAPKRHIARSSESDLVMYNAYRGLPYMRYNTATRQVEFLSDAAAGPPTAPQFNVVPVERIPGDDRPAPDSDDSPF